MNVNGSADDPAHALRQLPSVISPRRPSNRRQPHLLLAVGLVAIIATSCVDAISSIGEGPTPAATKILQLTDAITARYTTPERSGRFETARRLLVSGALVPSRVYSDSTMWSAMIPPATRELVAHGGLTDRGYRFESPGASELSRPGDTRHSIVLRQLADNEFRWDTGVDFAIGSITAADVGEVLTALLANGDERDPAAIRSAAHASFARSGAVLSRIFSVDSLTMRPGAQGTTTINMTIGVRPDGLRATAPHFADYVTKYVAKSHYRFTLADRNGAMYFEAVGGDYQVAIRYRVKAGSIVSYLGPPRPLPDSLRLTNDFAIHVKMFEVGWKNLVTDFTIRRSDHSRGWLVVAQNEPNWQLPLITERVLRSPLHRPFQGAGASFEIGVSDSAGAQTLLTRHTHLEVKESAILRFISGLVGRVFADLDSSVEREEAAYLRELAVAFQQDTRR